MLMLTLLGLLVLVLTLMGVVVHLGRLVIVLVDVAMMVLAIVVVHALLLVLTRHLVGAHNLTLDLHSKPVRDGHFRPSGSGRRRAGRLRSEHRREPQRHDGY
jgi:hypothetical protein